MISNLVMYHYILPEKHKFKNIPHIKLKDFKKHLKFFLQKGILKKGESFDDVINKKKIFLTFDDNLKCQYDYVLPLLNKYNIKAGFCIYYEPFLKKKISMLEKQRICQYFFKDYDNFFLSFENFFKKRKIDNKIKNFINFEKKNFIIIKRYLTNEKYYSLKERYVRFLRDKILRNKDYNDFINYYYKNKISKNINKKEIFFNLNQLKKIQNNGHILIPHSLSHSINLHLKNLKELKYEIIDSTKEFEKKHNIKFHKSFCYPCGKISHSMVKILKKNKIKLALTSGDKSNFSLKINKNYKIFRIDANKINT